MHSALIFILNSGREPEHTQTGLYCLYPQTSIHSTTHQLCVKKLPLPEYYCWEYDEQYTYPKATLCAVTYQETRF